MRTMDDRTGLEVLSENECLLIVGRASLGRLIAVEDGRPEVFPVNFRRDGSSIVFRTDDGTKLDLISGGQPVAFEADSYDRDTHTGWSVVMSGHAHEVTDPDELAALAKMALRPWAAGPKSRYVRIMPERVEGRRIVHLGDAYYWRDS
jgi:nitroimidazol reductase NimA-like FMN-containing flavoprotein (pyridoxamine 5'-phosphate oxidase superfamily)